MISISDAPTMWLRSGRCGLGPLRRDLVIRHRWRNAEFFILLGDAGRGRGIGTEATRLTLDYAFHITNLRNVHLTVLEPNTAGIRAYEKAGFRKIGERRQSGYWLSQRCNEVLMDAIPADFPGPSLVKHMMEAADTQRKDQGEE